MAISQNFHRPDSVEFKKSVLRKGFIWSEAEISATVADELHQYPSTAAGRLSLRSGSTDARFWNVSLRSPSTLHYNRFVPVLHNLRVTLEMIKWEHSIFALPFALSGAMLAAARIPSLHSFVWIIVAHGRSAVGGHGVQPAGGCGHRRGQSAHQHARLAGRTSCLPRSSPTFVVVSSAIFVLAASQLNRLALLLSPVALAVLLLYSYTKRVTRWSHLVLGFALGIAPSAAWIAVRGSLDPRILLLTAAVTFWVGGFDVLYACQDFDFDRQSGLHSIPRYVGIPTALWIARGFHLVMVGLLVALLIVFGMGKVADVGVVAVILLLLYEHSLVRPNDLSKLNAAFFTMNGVISVLFFVFVAGDLLLRK